METKRKSLLRVESNVDVELPFFSDNREESSQTSPKKIKTHSKNKNKKFCFITKQHKTKKWADLIKNINPDDIIQRVELNVDSTRYITGLEPKIINEQRDSFSGIHILIFVNVY